MLNGSVVRWKTLERWSSTAFLVGVVMFLVTAGFNAMDVLEGAGHTNLPLKQAFVGAGWIAGLVGLLGLYPALVDRSRWLVRVGAVVTAIGLLGYVAMTAVSLGLYTGVIEGDLASFAPVFIPVLLVGSLLSFPLFAVAVLRSRIHSRTVGVLLFGPTVLFVANVLTPTPPSVVLGVVSGLAVVYLGVGYLLRTGTVPTDRGEPAAGPIGD